MIIGGLQKLTLIDYPGKIACVVFTLGCNFRCHFCHNPELSEQKNGEGAACGVSRIEEKDFFEFLESRQGLLEAVCVTGGEPTLHQDLPDFLKRIKSLGFLVKVDTNGTNPGMLERLLREGLVDYFAMDIKTKLGTQNLEFKDYEKVIDAKVDVEKIKKSIKIIMASGLDYEFRTTVVPGLHTEEDILAIAEEIRGAKKYFLQQFVPGDKILDKKYRGIKPYGVDFLQAIRVKIKDFFGVCEVRA